MAKIETVDASLPQTRKRKSKQTFKKKRGEKRVVHHGIVHIQASFNNTIITVTDAEGSVLAWSSAGGIGFKGSRKGDAVCCHAGRDQRRSRCEGVRRAVRGGAGQRTGLGAGIRHSGAANICGT